MNWYVTLEALKSAGGIEGSDRDRALSRMIEAVSRAVDRATNTRFIPLTAVRKYEYNGRNVRGSTLYFDHDLFSMTTLTDRGSTQRALTEGTEYLLLPDNDGPPYYGAEILRSQGVTYEGGSTTSQQSFEATGLWSSTADTESASSIAENDPAADTQTTLHVKDGSKVGVGDTLLIGSEQVFVSARGDVDMGINTHGTTGAMLADETDTTLTLVSAPTDAVNVDEVLRIGSERMQVTAINSTSSFEVERAYAGTTLAAHSIGDDVFIRRTYTIARGANGTTAATHADDATITRYIAPAQIEDVVVAEVLAANALGLSSYQDLTSAGRGVTSSIDSLRKRAYSSHRRHMLESV